MIIFHILASVIVLISLVIEWAQYRYLAHDDWVDAAKICAMTAAVFYVLAASWIVGLR